MRLVVVLAVLMVGRSWWSWSELEARMRPDFDSYTVGGLGLFPSPVGRALGALGPELCGSTSETAWALWAVGNQSAVEREPGTFLAKRSLCPFRGL